MNFFSELIRVSHVWIKMVLQPQGDCMDNSRIPPQLEKNHVVPPSSQDEALSRYSVSGDHHFRFPSKTINRSRISGFFWLDRYWIILVITLPILCSRSNSTIPYLVLVIPVCFLNLYIKQKVPGIGSIFHIILEKWLFIPSVSCINPLSHSFLPHSQALHSLTCTKKNHNCKTHVCISANVQSKSLTQGQSHSRVWHSKEQ